jgi:DNA helicase-2/ATP-dependent DNA helicase PcrA
MIDEYQDTNKIQYMLVSLLAQKMRNICVVGDDDQSIYKFRGADITNILNFEKQFTNTKIIKLEENYRSTQNILNAANGVIKNNQKRKEKALWTQKTGGEQITHLTPTNNYDEAYKIQTEIENNLDRGYSYKDMAILYRMNSLSRTFEQVFLKNAIPHRIVGGVRFFDRKEIKDIIAYLRLIVNNSDDAALIRIINEPARGIGKTTIEKLQAISSKENISMLEVCKNANKYSELSSPKLKLINFYKMISDFSENIDDVEKLINSVINGSGYIDALKSENTEESENREKNIMELLSVIKENEENNNLTTFLENVALLSDIDNYDAGEDAITLMTLHSSKGLEFKIVFLIGFEDGIFPSNQSVNEIGGLEEERRLLYVGITRAKEILYISSALERMLYGNIMHSFPSRFLKEIPHDTIKSSFIQKYKNKIEATTQTYTTPKIQPVKTDISSDLPDYRAGIKVKHKKFGIGTVLSAQPLGNDIKLEIDFIDFGKKVLMAAFARPEII